MEAVLDVEVPRPEAPGPALLQPTEHIAFMSHEPTPLSSSAVRGQPAAPGQSSARRQPKLMPKLMQQPHLRQHDHHGTHHHGDHSHRGPEHQSFCTVSLHAESPASMAAFQRFVPQVLMSAKDLFRCKGFLWFGENRKHRYKYCCSAIPVSMAGDEYTSLGLRLHRRMFWHVGPHAGPFHCHCLSLLAGENISNHVQWIERPKTCLMLCNRPLWCRYTFQLSGRQRCECRQVEPWDSPPSCRLVFIGKDDQVLQAIKEEFCSACLNPHDGVGPSASAAGFPGSALTAAGAGAAEQRSLPALQEASAALEGLITQHLRFEVMRPAAAGPLAGGTPDGGQSDDQGAANASAASAVVEFSVQGSRLHGVIAEEVNGEVMRRVNASTKAFICCSSAQGMLSASTGTFQSDRVIGLQLALDRCTAIDTIWTAISDAAAPVLRKAFQHVHNCNCDMVRVL